MNTNTAVAELMDRLAKAVAVLPACEKLQAMLSIQEMAREYEGQLPERIIRLWLSAYETEQYEQER
jgi:hypothetical protein